MCHFDCSCSFQQEVDYFSPAGQLNTSRTIICIPFSPGYLLVFDNLVDYQALHLYYGQRTCLGYIFTSIYVCENYLALLQYSQPPFSFSPTLVLSELIDLYTFAKHENNFPLLTGLFYFFFKFSHTFHFHILQFHLCYFFLPPAQTVNIAFRRQCLPAEKKEKNIERLCRD